MRPNVYHLTSNSLHVEVWDHGARLVQVLAPDRHGDVTNVVLRHPSPDDYVGHDHAYFGATIGRYANRIARGRVSIAGRDHQLVVNEGKHQLHGGSAGFDQRIWETVSAASHSVTFRHVSRDGDQGFPGNVIVEVRFTVNGAELVIDTVAVTDADTVFGTTNHAYWNLAGTGMIADHELLARAPRVVEVDGELIPTGTLPNVADTQFDFATATPLAGIVEAGGIDHCLVPDQGSGVYAELSHPSSGRVLTIESDQPGLQVYTGQYLPQAFSGICLEPQQLPDTPNHPQFGTSLLHAGDTYRHHTSYHFGVATS